MKRKGVGGWGGGGAESVKRERKPMAGDSLSRWNGVFVGCVISQQRICESQGQVSSDHCLCCHIEIEVADQTIRSPSCIILIPGHPVSAPTLYRQAPDRVSTRFHRGAIFFLFFFSIEMSNLWICVRPAGRRLVDLGPASWRPTTVK